MVTGDRFGKLLRQIPAFSQPAADLRMVCVQHIALCIADIQVILLYHPAYLMDLVRAFEADDDLADIVEQTGGGDLLHLRQGEFPGNDVCRRGSAQGMFPEADAVFSMISKMEEERARDLTTLTPSRIMALLMVETR